MQHIVLTIISISLPIHPLITSSTAAKLPDDGYINPPPPPVDGYDAPEDGYDAPEEDKGKIPTYTLPSIFDNLEL